MSKIRTALVLVLLSSTPVFAASIDEAGALKLKDSLQKTLNYQKKLNEALSFEGDIKVNYTGDLKVTPQADFYAVEFPKISIQGKTEDGKDSTFDFGTITMNAIPGDKENEWKVMTSLPQTLKFGDGAMEINIGGQTIAGLFNGSYGLVKMNITLQDMTFKANGVDSGVKIGSVKYVSNMEQDATDQTFTGPSVMSLENFSLNDPKNSGTVTLDEIRADVSVEKLHIPTIDEMSAKLDENAKVLETVKKSADAPSPDDFKKFADLIFDIYQFRLQGFDATYSIKNLKAVPSAAEGGDIKAISLEQGHYGMGGKGMQTDSGDFGINFGYDGLSFEAAPEDTKIPPTNVSINLKADKIPYNAVTSLATTTLDTIKTNPDMAQMAGMATLFKLPAILAQAGSNITISNTFAKGADYNATVDGNVIADMNALATVTGKIQGVFAGLDTLIDLASKSKTYTDLVEPLNALKAEGTPTTKDGVPAYSFDLEATKDGKFLINGKDVNTQPAVPAPAVESGEAVPSDVPAPQ